MKIGLDLDGTLLTCKDRQAALMKAAATQLGQAFDPDAYWEQKREGANNLLALQSIGVEEETARALSSIWNHNIERFPWLAFDRPFPGILDALRRLKQHHELHLITARSISAHLHLQLVQMQLRQLFDSVTVVPNADVPRRKAQALRATGCALFIGDTESDGLAALEAHIPFAAVSSGMRCSRFLASRGITEVEPTLIDQLHRRNLLH